MTSDDMTANVERGAKLLDSVMPGWWKLVSTSILDMNDIRYCVLGQLYGGDYMVGIKALGFYDSLQSRATHGFILDASANDCSTIITPLWMNAIMERRG